MSNYPPRLAPGDIKYLALEGGGGKGNAFLGALESLGHPSLNVITNTGYRLTNIRGVAGASAGAITAFFLAAGFSPLELRTITELEDFSSFLDQPNPGRVFRIGGFETHTAPPTATEAALVSLVKETLALFQDLDVTRMARYVVRHVRVSDIHRSLRLLQNLADDLPRGSLLEITAAVDQLGRLVVEDAVVGLQAVSEILAALPAVVWGHFLRICSAHLRLVGAGTQSAHVMMVFAAIQNLLYLLTVFEDDRTHLAVLSRDADETAQAFVRDFGMMTGEEIYKFFRRWLAVALLRVRNPEQYERYVPRATSAEELPERLTALKGVVDSGANAELTRYRDGNISFEEFEEQFAIKLAITGTNLETLTSHVFSGATTPRFYVVDAVRLSMALPYCLFKPLVIRVGDPRFEDVKGPGEVLRERDPVSGKNERHPLFGVWVDGGLFNNIPSHVFDRQADNDCQRGREAAVRAGTDPDAVRVETLALRLDSAAQMMPEAVTDVVDYFRQFPWGIKFGSGEALAARSYDNKYRAIALDTGDLTLLSFSPTAAQSRGLRLSAIDFVFRYFDTPVPADLRGSA